MTNDGGNRGNVAKEKCEPDRQVSVARAMRNERRMTRVRRLKSFVR